MEFPGSELGAEILPSPRVWVGREWRMSSQRAEEQARLWKGLLFESPEPTQKRGVVTRTCDPRAGGGWTAEPGRSRSSPASRVGPLSELPVQRETEETKMASEREDTSSPDRNFWSLYAHTERAPTLTSAYNTHMRAHTHAHGCRP